MSDTGTSLQQLRELMKDLADAVEHLQQLQVLATGTSSLITSSELMLNDLSALSITADVGADFSDVAIGVITKTEQVRTDLRFLQPLVQLGGRCKALGFAVPLVVAQDDGTLMLSTIHDLAREAVVVHGAGITALLEELGQRSEELTDEYDLRKEEVMARLNAIPRTTDTRLRHSRDYMSNSAWLQLLKQLNEKTIQSLDRVGFRVDEFFRERDERAAMAEAEKQQQDEYRRAYKRLRNRLSKVEFLLKDLDESSSHRQRLIELVQHMNRQVQDCRHEIDEDHTGRIQYQYYGISSRIDEAVENLLAEVQGLLAEQDHVKATAVHLQQAQEHSRQERVPQRSTKQVLNALLDRILTRRFGVPITLLGSAVAAGGLTTSTVVVSMVGGLVLVGGVIKLSVPKDSLDTTNHSAPQETAELDWTAQLVLDMNHSLDAWGTRLSEDNRITVTNLARAIVTIAQTSITAADPQTQEELRLRTSNLIDVVNTFTRLRLSDESRLAIAQSHLVEHLDLVGAEVQRIGRVADDAALGQQAQLGHYLREVTGSSALSITRE